MATTYPTALTTYTNPSATDQVAVAVGGRTHSQFHSDNNDDIEALQAKVGIDGSAVTTSHDYKLSGVTGSDKAVSKTGTETLTNKTLTSPIITNKTSTGTDNGVETLDNKTLTRPKIVTSIDDTNGNEVIKTPATASAVNEVTITNAATGSNPSINPTGDDANIGLDITPKGTGTVNIKGNATQAATVRLYEDTDDGSNYSSFKPGTQSASIDYTLPTIAPTVSGQVLNATTSGVMSWSNVSALSDDFYGDGSDGDVVIAGTTTLTSDMYYNNLEVTGTLNTAGYRVFVKGTLSGNGVIQNNGNAGGDGVTGVGAGAGGTATVGYFSNNAGSIGAAEQGSSGSNGNNAGNTSAITSALITTASSAGGVGGANGGGLTGGTSGTSGARTAVLTRFGVLKFATAAGVDIAAAGGTVKVTSSMGGLGGGGGAKQVGGGAGAGAPGGGGGASGGIVALFVRIWAGTTTIKALGGAGGAGGNGGSTSGGGGAGGGGGNGGYILVVYGTKSWTGSFDVSGGAAGAAGTNDGGGTQPTAATAGSSGTTKEIIGSNLF